MVRNEEGPQLTFKSTFVAFSWKQPSQEAVNLGGGILLSPTGTI